LADDITRARALTAPRLLAGAAVMAVTLALAAPAGAAANAPALTERQVTFAIPANGRPSVVWTLNVWQQGTLLETASGSTGVLVALVPRTVSGVVQADVRRNNSWYSGKRFNITGGHHGGGHHGGGHHGGGGGRGGSGGKGSGGKGGGGSAASGPGHHGKRSAPTTTVPAADPQPRNPTPAAPPARPGSALAFTGVGNAFRDAAVAGAAMEVAGLVLLLARRRRVRLPRP